MESSSESLSATTPVGDDLTAMAATTELLASATDLGNVLRRLARRTRELTHADYAAACVLDESGQPERFMQAGVDQDAARRLGTMPQARGLLGSIALSANPVRIDDVTAHPAYTGWPRGHPALGPVLGIPVRTGGRVVGCLFAARSAGLQPFGPEDERAAVILGLQATISIADGMARERSGRVSAIDERQGIAHDLREGTVQSLSELGRRFESIATDRANTDKRAAILNGAMAIEQLAEEVRQYVDMLEAEEPRSEPELSRDLPFVIRQIVPTGVDTVLNVTAVSLQRLGPRESEHLLHIAREALTNAVRHGRPTKIAVDLREEGGEASLTIQDNGAGFDPANAHVGLGMIGMRTRAERIGASLVILGIPGMGTTVRVLVPRQTVPRA